MGTQAKHAICWLPKQNGMGGGEGPLWQNVGFWFPPFGRHSRAGSELNGELLFCPLHQFGYSRAFRLAQLT